jgi:hypothetical protein
MAATNLNILEERAKRLGYRVLLGKDFKPPSDDCMLAYKAGPEDDNWSGCRMPLDEVAEALDEIEKSGVRPPFDP